MVSCFYGYLLISLDLGQCPDDVTTPQCCPTYPCNYYRSSTAYIVLGSGPQVRCPMQCTPVSPILCDYSASYLSFCLLYSRPAHSIKVYSYSTRISISIVSFFPSRMPIPLEHLISFCFPHFAAPLSAAHLHYLIPFTYPHPHPLHGSSIINCHRHPQFPIPMVTFIL